MRIVLVCIREHYGRPGGPEEKASRYTVRPGTLDINQVRHVAIYGLNKLDKPNKLSKHLPAYATRHVCRLNLKY
jgi:hypothetical protein